VPDRQIRAAHDDATQIVYQAFRPAIADAAREAGRFVAPFSFDRMTWIKPSFTWMMHRSSWATAPGQERVLAVHLRRNGFAEALQRACLSAFQPDVHGDDASWREQLRHSDVRVQWDPERTWSLQPLPYRTIQVGLARQALMRYVEAWICDIVDVTDRAHAAHDLVTAGQIEAARALVPAETELPVDDDVRHRLGMA
jgi:hypothetical protein